MADKWYVYLTNDRIVETIYLQASSEQSLQAKVEKQQLAWNKKEHEEKIQEIKLQTDDAINKYREGLQAFRNIIKLKLNGLANHDNY